MLEPVDTTPQPQNGDRPDGASAPEPPAAAMPAQPPTGPNVWTRAFSETPGAPHAVMPASYEDALYGPPSPLPAQPAAETPSKRPWPAPGHSRLHAKDRPRPRRWWTPLLTALLGGAIWGAVAFVLGVGLGLWIAIRGGGIEDLTAIIGGADADFQNPWFYVFNFGIIALMIPALAIAVRVVEGVRLGALSSNEGHLRRGLVLRALGLAVLTMSPSIALSIHDAAAGGIASAQLSAGAVLLPLILLLVPIQCAAEEYVFRGFVLRALMGWGMAPVLAMVVAVVPFTLGHIYGWKGLLDVAVFGLCMAWLAVRTGGLEASIALHVVNNLVGAVFSAFGQGNLFDDDVPVWILIVSLAQILVYTAIADRLWSAKKAGDGDRLADRLRVA